MGQTVVKTGAIELSGSTLIYSSAAPGVYSALIDLIASFNVGLGVT